MPPLRKVLSCRPRTKPPRDRSDEVRAGLNAAEARRAAREERKREAIQEAVARALRENRNPKLIKDPKARTVDAIMRRWAVGHGSGLPPEDPGALECRPPQLDDATQCVIDDIITKRVPGSVRWLVCQWYRSKTPCPIMAKERRISERTLYRHWELVLMYLGDLFFVSGHSDLVTMLRMVGA